MASKPEPTPAERVDDIPRILSALRDAVRDAIRRHKAAGHSVAVWRNGRVEWVAPGDIPVEVEAVQAGEPR